MHSFITHFNKLPDFLIYISLGFVSFLENLIPPIPGDLITVFGGFLVGTGRLHFLSVIIATTFGSLLGFICLYWIGGVIDRKSILKRDFRLFKMKHIIRAENWFKKYGYFVILINRFLPGFRSVISITAGISGLNAFKVVMLSFLSCALWNIMWVITGFTFGNNWSLVEKDISLIFVRYNTAMFSLIVIIILFLIIRGAAINKKGDNDPTSTDLDT